MEYVAVATPQSDFGLRCQSRTREVARCLQLNPEWILLLDADQTLPIYQFPEREAPYDVLVYDAPNRGVDDSNIYRHPDGTLDYFTISCCFIKAKVFKELSRPWFRSDIAFVKDGVVNGKYFYTRPNKSVDDNIGEDVYFSKRLVDNDYKIRVVEGVKSKHFSV